ncbi:hypothetical protein QQ045_006224 [Rhodiola kirilowii]
MLIWRIYTDSLPSKMSLHRRRVLLREPDLLCVLCGEAQEETDHLIVHCDWSRRLWSECFRWWGSSWTSTESAKDLLLSWEVGGHSRAFKRLRKTLGYATMWSIWEERNKRCFQSQKRSVEEVLELVKARVAWWAKFRRTNCPYTVATIKRCIEEVKEHS